MAKPQLCHRPTYAGITAHSQTAKDSRISRVIHFKYWLLELLVAFHYTFVYKCTVGPPADSWILGHSDSHCTDRALQRESKISQRQKDPKRVLPIRPELKKQTSKNDKKDTLPFLIPFDLTRKIRRTAAFVHIS